MTESMWDPIIEGMLLLLVLLISSLLVALLVTIQREGWSKTKSLLWELAFLYPKNFIPIKITQLSFVQIAYMENFSEKSALEPPKQLFIEGDIVYLLPGAGIPASKQYPCLASPYAIDCKVFKVKQDLNTFVYDLISGHGNRVLPELPQEFLVAPKDKNKYEASRILELIEDTELAPKGTQFFLINGYYASEELGVYLEKEFVETSLMNLFV